MTKSKTDSKAIEQANEEALGSSPIIQETALDHSELVANLIGVIAVMPDDFTIKGMAGRTLANQADWMANQSREYLDNVEQKVIVAEDGVRDNRAGADIQLERAENARVMAEYKYKTLLAFRKAAHEAYYLATGEHWTPQSAAPKQAKPQTPAERAAQMLARSRA